MTVSDLCNLYLGGLDIVEIWDGYERQTVFRGTFREAINCDYYGIRISGFWFKKGTMVIKIF